MSYIPSTYRVLNSDSLPAYLSTKLPKEIILGGEPSSWKVDEVGDGNINLVFIVSGSQSTIVVKQAIPYVRAAGESWALSLQRAFFEYNTLKLEYENVGRSLVPDVYFYDESMATFAMEYISPHIVLRKEMIKGKKFDSLANDIGTFLARNLFFTSDIGLNAKDKKELTSKFSLNHELCKITEDLIFTEPYYDAERNNWSTPLLDEHIYHIWSNKELIRIAMKYKYKFMTEAQALLHGDLHTGSIMVTKDKTIIIDPEFGFMGPMAFDIGNYIGNLIMSYTSQPAHIKNKNQLKDYQTWILEQINDTWDKFVSEFTQLWNAKQEGDAYPNEIYQQKTMKKSLIIELQYDFFRNVFIDTLVNAGMEINRRVIGFAGVADLKTISDENERAYCCHHALNIGCYLMLNASKFNTIYDVSDYIRSSNGEVKYEN
ncbi:S-methyl-5-thioribose kinase [Testudinibacter aquarius]|uniref:S-methyl-5-thioribose kinase n=3 Tax=Testudinibacter aquarius TaxID=1524974 RepID=A0A4R3YCL7_9PAST|nr:S-methyl-5-thioribose kinase [Testudinibacter aquarius]KAE9528334.1 S-methyl-5-thioribose kinase [Testudinibacter aquarius]TCV88828.1 5'-methylthioribose kinase [Testudinibacter aquarius]